MASLTPEQETHLKMIRTANLAWREAKMFARVRAKDLAEQEVSTFLVTMDAAVRRGFDAGVPKRQINIAGLGTKSPDAADESLNRSAGLVELLKAIEQPLPVERFSVAPEVGFEDYLLITVNMEGPEWAAFKKTNQSHFRKGKDVASVNSGTYRLFEGRAGHPMDGTDDSTANTWDSAVTAWLRTDEGRDAVQDWLYANMPELLQDEEDEDLI